MARNDEKNDVLVSRFSALGDIAMTIPPLYDACNANPGRKFIMLTRGFATGMFVNPPANLTVIGVDLKEYPGPKGMARLASELAMKYAIGVYVDLHDVLRTQMLRLFMRLRGVRVYHIDKGRRDKKKLTRPNDKIMVQLPSTVSRYRDVFAKAGLRTGHGFVSLYDSTPPDLTLFAAVSSPKKPGERWIGVAPFAKHKGKIYPPELIDKVVGHFDHLKSHRIFIFGAGREEKTTIKEMADKYSSVVNMAEANIGFAGELALMSQCDVVLSMDSANMHLASLVGTRVVSVWGATHPFCGFGGWRQRPEDEVQLDMVCRPCSVFGDKECSRGDYHCLRGISPQTIISRLS